MLNEHTEEHYLYWSFFGSTPPKQGFTRVSMVFYSTVHPFYLGRSTLGAKKEAAKKSQDIFLAEKH